MMQPSTTSGGEADFVGAQQGGDDDVAAGLHLAVGLHADTAAQAVQHQRLLGFGQAQFPRRAGVLDRRQRRSAGAAVMAGDHHVVGLGLGHTGGTVPTPTSDTSLTEIEARGLAFFRSWISCARSSIE
jgi:hypothetical protein